MLINTVQEIRTEDPRIGGYKLWLMLICMFGFDAVPGRDSFFTILRRRGMMLPKPKLAIQQTQTIDTTNGRIL